MRERIEKALAFLYRMNLCNFTYSMARFSKFLNFLSKVH